MIQDFKGKEIFNMENEKVKNVINIIKDMNIKDKLRLGICLTTSDWANILYNRNKIYKRFDIMLKEIDEEYRTTLINFGSRKYFNINFAMAWKQLNKIKLLYFYLIAYNKNYVRRLF